MLLLIGLALFYIQGVFLFSILYNGLFLRCKLSSIAQFVNVFPVKCAELSVAMLLIKAHAFMKIFLINKTPLGTLEISAIWYR